MNDERPRDRPPRATPLAAALAVLVLGLALASCDNSDDDDPAGPLQPTAWNVSYLVQATGASTVDIIRYRTADGTDLSVTPTSLPWAADVQFLEGGTTFLEAEGTADGGAIQIDISAVAVTGGDPVAEEARCEDDPSGPRPCLLTLGPLTLN